jgi:hypothetical protein
MVSYRQRIPQGSSQKPLVRKSTQGFRYYLSMETKLTSGKTPFEVALLWCQPTRSSTALSSITHIKKHVFPAAPSPTKVSLMNTLPVGVMWR